MRCLLMVMLHSGELSWTLMNSGLQTKLTRMANITIPLSMWWNGFDLIYTFSTLCLNILDITNTRWCNDTDKSMNDMSCVIIKGKHSNQIASGHLYSLNGLYGHFRDCFVARWIQLIWPVWPALSSWTTGSDITLEGIWHVPAIISDNWTNIKTNQKMNNCLYLWWLKYMASVYVYCKIALRSPTSRDKP